MQRSDSLKENRVEVSDMGSTFKLEFEDASESEELLNKANSLLTATGTKLSAGQLDSTGEDTMVNYLMNSDEYLTHNFITSEDDNSAHLPYVYVHQSLLIINHKSLHNECDEVPPYLETRRQPNDVMDLVVLTASQEASCNKTDISCEELKFNGLMNNNEDFTHDILIPEDDNTPHQPYIYRPLLIHDKTQHNQPESVLPHSETWLQLDDAMELVFFTASQETNCSETHYSPEGIELMNSDADFTHDLITLKEDNILHQSFIHRPLLTCDKTPHNEPENLLPHSETRPQHNRLQIVTDLVALAALQDASCNGMDYSFIAPLGSMLVHGVNLPPKLPYSVEVSN